MLDSGLDPSLNLDSQVLLDLLKVWRGACEGREMPSRGDIDPLDIDPSLLPYILLVDVEHQPQRRYRWRLIGTHLVERVKRDSTGRYWDELYIGDAFDVMRSRVDWVLQHRLPIRAIGHAGSKNVNPRLKDITNLEGLYLPLSSDGETIDMILMGAVYSSLK